MSTSNASFTRIGTAGGTITAMLANLHGSDLINTAVLAAVGAVVSYVVSLGLKMVVRRIKHRRERKSRE